LGAWEGAHQDRAGWWLRWWNADREMLLWGEELTEQERQRAEQERQRADQAEQALEKAEQGKQTAIARLLTLGLSPEQIADTLSISVTDIPERP